MYRINLSYITKHDTFVCSVIGLVVEFSLVFDTTIKPETVIEVCKLEMLTFIKRMKLLDTTCLKLTHRLIFKLQYQLHSELKSPNIFVLN